nr:retrovirus-related Pol polyprotein LINE-1 [Tanacetum cinerariifolium]
YEVVHQEMDIRIGDQILQPKESFRYLGSVIHRSGMIDDDVAHRIGAGWMKWRAASRVLCDWRIPLKLKGKFCKVRLDQLCYMIPNGVFRAELDVDSLVNKMGEGRLRWFGHVKRRPWNARLEELKPWKLKARGEGHQSLCTRTLAEGPLEAVSLLSGYPGSRGRICLHFTSPTPCSDGIGHVVCTDFNDHLLFQCVYPKKVWDEMKSKSDVATLQQAVGVMSNMGIKLFDHTMKLWERVIERRLQRETSMSENQFGFMPGRSLVEAIHLIRSLIEKYRERLRDLHMTFLDLEKAYDSVPRELIWKTLVDKGTSRRYIKVIRNMYDDVCIGDKILQPKESFRYLESMLHKSGRINEDVSNRIKATWMKWRAATVVLCDRKGRSSRIKNAKVDLWGRPQSAPVRRVEALVVDGLRRSRPKLKWEDRVKHDMKELLLFEDMTSDRNE